MKKLSDPILRGKAALAAIILVLEPAQLNAQTYDLSADFSKSNNPAGAWSYGFRSPGQAFQLYLYPFDSITLDVWSDSSGSNSQLVYNPNTDSVHYLWGNIIWMPKEISLHPTGGGLLSIARFTAPTAGSYSLTTKFQGIDIETLPTGISVWLNEQVIFSEVTARYAYRATHHFTKTLSLQQGDTVDFAVDQGPDNMVDDGTIAIEATLTVVPPSATLPLPVVTLMSAGGLEWSSVPGLTYQVQRSAGLEAWDDVGNPVAGDGTIKSVPVPLAPPPVPTFLRLKVEKP